VHRKNLWLKYRHYAEDHHSRPAHGDDGEIRAFECDFTAVYLLTSGLERSADD